MTAYEMKARVGDYVRDERGVLRRVANVTPDAQDGCAGYVLANGALLLDSELSVDGVLLESEAHEIPHGATV